MTNPSAARDIVLTVCRDEADIIEAFVRFNLAMGFDAVYVVDNGSTDGTDAILRRLADEGLPLTWKRDLRLGYDLHLTEHYHWAGADANPRWLFFLDVDEFVYFPNGAKNYLQAAPPDVTALRLLQRQMYQTSLTPSGTSPWFFLHSTIGATTFDDEPSKVVTRYDPEARVYGGKHLIEGPTLHETTPSDLYIRHFKYRSAAQARSKERNRINSEAAFSDQDIQALSAFSWDQTKEWMQQCRAMAEREEWRTWFDPHRPLTVDDALARWVTNSPGRAVQARPIRDWSGLPLPERLLALEAELQTEASFHEPPAMATAGTSEHFERYLRARGRHIVEAAADADLILVRADAPGDDTARLTETLTAAIRPRARAIIRPLPDQATPLIASLRSGGLHAMKLDADFYGQQIMEAVGVGSDEILVSATVSVRPDPSGKNRAVP